MADRRIRSWIVTGLAVAALAELIVLALLAADAGGVFWLGPVRISLRTFDNPFWIGLTASAGVLLLGWRSDTHRRLACLLMAGLIALAVVVLARSAPAVVTKSDIAVTELYVRLAMQQDLLVGPYSRFGWHHPGPLYFWLQTPFYALSGNRGTGLYAGALALNLAALGTLAWTLLRVDRGALAVSILGSWLVFAWRDRWLMASPWTAHMPVLATMTFLVLAAAVGSGRLRMLPLLTLFGSFMLQTHLAVGPLVIVVSAGALAAGLILTVRERRVSPWPIVNRSAWLFAALWLLPLVEQLSHTPGNLTRLWNFFGGVPQPTHPYSTAFGALSYALVGVLRPDLYTPYGGHFHLTHLGWGVPVVIAELAALLIVATHALRHGRRFEAAMALTALTATFTALWSITRIRGDILDHEIFWIVGLGAMNLGILAAAAVRVAAARWLRGFTVDGRITSAACVLLVLASVRVGIRHFDQLVAFESSTARDAPINATYDSVRRYLVTHDVRKPLFRIDGTWDVAAATFVRLHQTGVPFAIDEQWVHMFTDAFRVQGDEDAIVTIGGRDRHRELSAAPDHVALLERHPVYVHAVRIAR